VLQRDVINGRAGPAKHFGSGFRALRGRPVAWYKVDAADSDLRMFCEYLSRLSACSGLDE